MKPRATLERLVFYLSLIVLAFSYGWGSGAFGWFPDAFLSRAAHQAVRAVSPPMYLQPGVYDREGVQWFDSTADVTGLILMATRGEEDHGTHVLQLLDRTGRVHHRWHLNPDELERRTDSLPSDVTFESIEERALHGVHVFPNGDVVANVEYFGTVRLDACSRIEWFLPAGSHHSIASAGEGRFWIPGNTTDRRLKTAAYPDGFAGLKGAVHLDQLLLVSGDGRVLERINVLDVLYDNGLQRHIFKSGQDDDPDVTHLNDIEPLPDSIADEFPAFNAGDLLVSLRNLDLILVLDPAARRVKWHVSHPFIRQHDPDFLAQGWIGVFDNNRDGTPRGSASGGSRIVAVKPGADTMRVLYPGTDSRTFYTEVMGKWQQLENGHMLLTEAAAGRVVEVTSTGREVWEWIAPTVDSGHVPELTEGTRLSVTLPQVGEWPCNDGPPPVVLER